MPDYDFGQLYGQADHSGVVLVDKGVYDAVVTKSEWGRTKAGDKGQWTVQVAITTGQFAGSKLTSTITVSPVKDDGTPNEKGQGIMFRHLRALGIPVDLPGQPLPPGVRNFWEMGWDENVVAQQMLGKPVQIQVIHDNYDDTPRAKVRDFREARPGAPLQVEKPQQQGNGYAQPSFAGAGGGSYGPPSNAGGGGGGWPQQQQQPGWPQQQPGPVAPGPWQGQPSGPGAYGQPPAGIPGAPSYAQPPVPGQGGVGEFTQQGQSYQGYQGQPDPYQQATGQQPGPAQYQGGYGMPQGPEQYAQQPPQGQLAMPPWAQPQQPQPGQQPEQPGQVPPPPWA